VKPIKPIEQSSWLTAIVIGLALLVFIVPPIWLGYKGFGLFLVFGFGLAVTLLIVFEK
jgi:multisubunit Na+/H+ antiporter MnhC subunit